MTAPGAEPPADPSVGMLHAETVDALPAPGVVSLLAPPRAYVVRHEGPQRRRRRSLHQDRRLLADVARRLAASLDLAAILPEVVRLLHHHFGYSTTAVYLADPSRRWLRLRAAYGDMIDPLQDGNHRQRADQGLIGKAFKTGIVVRADDAPSHPGYLPVLPGTRCELCVPLRVAGEVIGVLDVQLRELNGFRDQDEALLCEVADQLAPALRNAALYEESQRRAAELHAVAEIASAISSRLELDALLDEIHHQVSRVMLVDASFVALEREVIRAAWPDITRLFADLPLARLPAETHPLLGGVRQHDLVLARAYEGNERFTADEGKAFCLYRTSVTRAIARREPVLRLRTADDMAALRAGKTTEDKAAERQAGGARLPASLLFAPLIAGGEVLGVLSVQSYEFDAYDAWHAQLLGTIANQAAVAVHNARLFTLAGEAKALRALNELKDEFVATVSHELRTPLALIFGFAELLARPYRSKNGASTRLLQPEQERRAVLEIHAAADHMRRIVEDLLDLSRLAHHSLALRLAPVDVSRALTEVQEAAQKTLAEGQRIVFEVPPVPAVLTALADAGRLRQVLLNLLHNASRYSLPGTAIRLGAELRGGEMHLWVTDEGAGLTSEQCERAFDRFWRGPIEVTSGRPGAGLGLAICRSLVEAMHGRIWAESPGPGRGSTFHVLLPAVVGR